MIGLIPIVSNFIKMEREIEDKVISEINLNFPEIDFVKVDSSEDKDYFARNYLSIMFLLIYDRLQIDKEMIFLLGVLNFAVRSVVTCTDNLLDDEDKYLFISRKIDVSANRSQSLIGLIVSQYIIDLFLEKEVNINMISYQAKSQIKNKLYAALFEIGVVEAQEENSHANQLTPEEVLDKVNYYRGSKLLELAFIPLSIIRQGKEIETAIQGVHEIGMGLQILDDISDIEIDISSNKRNYLAAVIINKYKVKGKQILADLENKSFSDKYNSDIRGCFKKAVSKIETGISRIQNNKILLNKKTLNELIKFMLINRKMEAYISMLNDL